MPGKKGPERQESGWEKAKRVAKEMGNVAKDQLKSAERSVRNFDPEKSAKDVKEAIISAKEAVGRETEAAKSMARVKIGMKALEKYKIMSNDKILEDCTAFCTRANGLSNDIDRIGNAYILKMIVTELGETEIKATIRTLEEKRKATEGKKAAYLSQLFGSKEDLGKAEKIANALDNLVGSLRKLIKYYETK